MKSIQRTIPALVLLALLAGSPAWAHNQIRWMCGVVPISCGHKNQPTCGESSGCHSGYSVWDIPDSSRARHIRTRNALYRRVWSAVGEAATNRRRNGAA